VSWTSRRPEPASRSGKLDPRRAGVDDRYPVLYQPPVTVQHPFGKWCGYVRLSWACGYSVRRRRLVGHVTGTPRAAKLAGPVKPRTPAQDSQDAGGAVDATVARSPGGAAGDNPGQISYEGVADSPEPGPLAGGVHVGEPVRRPQGDGGVIGEAQARRRGTRQRTGQRSATTRADSAHRSETRPDSARRHPSRRPPRNGAAIDAATSTTPRRGATPEPPGAQRRPRTPTAPAPNPRTTPDHTAPPQPR
jgi:hypothetical protein